MWSSLRRVTNKFCEIIHPDIILRNFKKKYKSDPYSEKDLLSTLSHYITRKEGMDSVIVDKKLNDRHNRKHIKRQSLDTYRERLTPKMLYNLFNNILENVSESNETALYGTHVPDFKCNAEISAIIM